MQSPAEAVLIERAAALLAGIDAPQRTLLNVGAGASTIVEDEILRRLDGGFVCDRLDVEPCPVTHPLVRRSVAESVERMSQVGSAQYALVVSNYVLEHVPDCDAALREVARVLRPGGRFVLTVPNPDAPEFAVARRTPTWFHQAVKGPAQGTERAYPTFYAYGSVDGLVARGRAAGLEPEDLRQTSFVLGYLARWPALVPLARAWDGSVNRLALHRLQGHVCLTLRKPGLPATP
jgi:SAM-dependent methyltransferase